MSPLWHATSSQSFDETRWVINIQQSLDGDLEDDNEIPVCIFNVPKALISSNPDSYTPQQVAIGPYHFRRPVLYEMERYKLAAVRRMQEKLRNLNFGHFVAKLIEAEPKIRACYHRYLEFNGETLAWIMALDTSFLLEFLQIYLPKEGKGLTRLSSRLLHLVDYEGRKLGHPEVLRDILMLENQIPLFVLRQMLEFQIQSLESADDTLFLMLMGLCKELSPFKMMGDLSKIQVSESAHILDFLYKTIVPKMEVQCEITEEEDEDKGEPNVRGGKEPSGYSGSVGQLLRQIKLFIRRLFSSRPAGFMLKLPWNILSNLPGFAVLKVSAGCLFPGQENEARQEDGYSNSCDRVDKPPLIEEITIPSVSELYKSGVCFIPTNGNISTIGFDFNSGAFNLPSVSLDTNTEVILRNLVAYEAANTSGPLVLTRYAELMNGIIDDEEDVRLLRQQGIVSNHLKSDEEAAKLWNGMSKSVRLTKVPFLDKVIEDANKYYNGRWKVKVGKFLKQYIYGSWQFLAFLAGILLLLLVSLQAVSLLYSCMRLFRLNPSQ